MKKIFLILGLFLLGATPAFAEYCAGGYGDIFTAVNGKKYCLSRTTMNWWSAHAWCNSIGKTLINPSEDCDCTGYEQCEVGLDCPNLKGIITDSNKTAWTNIPGESGFSLVLTSTSRFWNSHRANKGFVVCK